jgi:BspA type Leucine rich repeat region (6 copies)
MRGRESKAGGYSIPNSVTVIGEQAFAACTGLTSVVIPNSVISIESYAFDSCTSLTSITIGAAITSLTYTTFTNCHKVTNLTISAGTTSISYSPLALLGLTSVTISDSVTSIGGNAFSGFTTLTNITIGNSVTSIGTSAFQSCSALTSVTIPNSVTSIGTSAFQSCSALTGVTIGSGVASIGNSAFLTCPNLITIYIKGNAPSLGTTVFTANPKSNVYYLLGTTGWTSTYGGLSTVALGLPTITGQPSSIIANASENTAFSVIAKTNFPLTLSYQWYRNGLIIATATAASLYLNDVQSTNVGTYTVIITNDAGSVSCSATLTLTQSTLYTQGQYDSALQTGLSAGFSVGMATGRTQVTDNPNSYGLYRLAQVQSLNVGAPLLSKDQVSGKFKLTIGVKKSSDLLKFIPFPIPTGAAVLNPQGEMEFQFTSPDNVAFYRLESH